MSEGASTPSQNRSPSATANTKESIEIIGITLAGAVTVVMADRSFSLLSAMVGFIILLVLSSDEFGELGPRIYSALYALGAVIIFGYWMDMLLLYVTQEFRWLSAAVGSIAEFLDDIGFLPLQEDVIGEPDEFEPGPMWMSGYRNLFQILMVGAWYAHAALIYRKRTGGSGWRCLVYWWKTPTQGESIHP